MQTKRQSIENFTKLIDELISSSYVLYEKKLTDLMRAISSSKLLYTLFEFCTSDLDYEKTYKVAFTEGEGGYGKGKFVLPKDAKTQIAFIFALLFKINSKEINFLDILERYFFVKTHNESYRNFSLQVLLPFRSAVLKVAEAMAEDGGTVQKPSEPVVVTNKVKSISVKDVKTIVELLEESYSIIMQYKIEPGLKAELLDLYQNFKDCLYEGEPKNIRIGYLGYKYATLYHRKLDLTMQKIEKILKDNDILH